MTPIERSSKAAPTRRRYHSPAREKQAQQTRARIIATAAAQFATHGYAATTMRSVAAEAHVAVPTIELAFGTKAQLLKAAVDTATAGDNEPVPMLSRPWAARAQATNDAVTFLEIFAGALTDAAERAAGLMMVALEAAPLDPDIAEVADQLMQQRQVMASWLVDGIRRRQPLRDHFSPSAALDTVWVLMYPAVFCRLTRLRHWTPAQFRRWFSVSVSRLLIDQHPPA
jgi:AcrR family transcriptional regulator